MMGTKRPWRKGGQREKRDELRSKLFDEQKGLCWICGKPMTLQRKGLIDVGPKFATFDHRVPHANGGTCHITNLHLAHRRCNNNRNALTVEEARVRMRKPDKRAHK
jgi:5-methylcytosine-specific restriction endonuclease McrA